MGPLPNGLFMICKYGFVTPPETLWVLHAEGLVMTHQDGCGAEHGTSCASHLQQRGSCKELSKGHRFEEIETFLLH